MYVTSDIIANWTSKLDGLTGTCTVVYTDYTSDSGTATVAASLTTVTAICTVTPQSNKTVESVTYLIDTCAGQIELSVSNINTPVVGGYSHAIIVTAKLATPV
jgi:hypothetical protein